MPNFLVNLEEFITDILFPIYCIGCAKEGFLLCPDCIKITESISVQVCPRCEKSVTLGGKLCLSCKDSYDFPLDQMVISASYKDPLLARSIHLYKYNFIQDLHIPLGELMVSALKKQPLSIPDYIIPMPLHRKRLRFRGFNQSQLLANYISQELTPPFEIPVLPDTVIRAKNTTAQMRLKRLADRQANVKNAFSLNPENQSRLKGKKLLLVDDICTTGATLLELSKELKKAEPHSIAVVVLARQS